MSHPDPALLVAYLDETLFHRDAAAIDRHLEGCAECTALLAAMREKREAEQARHASRWRMIAGAATVLVALGGYGLWTVLRQSTVEPARETEATRSETPPPSPAASAPAPAATPASAPAPAPARTTARPAPARQSPRLQSVKPAPAPPAAVEKRAPRQAAPPPPARVQWRTRDQLVESSTDGGTTWMTDHTADRPIRASAFIGTDVAWVVGDGGLILRRTKNGWFGASPPADGNITAVKASSPSKATVTLEDGRVFTTANGGVTWASAP